MFLCAQPANGHQTALFKTRQFPLDRTGANPRQTDQFGRVEAAIRLTEQQPEHALLRRGEQCVRQASRFFRAYGTCFFDPTHSGHITTHSGYVQVLRL